MALLAAEQILAPILRNGGYERSGQTWRKVRESIVLVVGFQRQHAIVFVDLGICIQTLGSCRKPRVKDCHIHLRLERVCPPEYFESVRTASADGAPAGFVAAFEHFGLPWLESLASRRGVQIFLRSSLVNRGFVNAAVWSWAGVDGRPRQK
jgi:hypothetical protein